jgi:hypothetical protein
LLPDGKKDAFREKLPDNAEAVRAQSQTNADFPESRRGSRGQQISHVGAGDQEHQPDHGHQYLQGIPDLPAQNCVSGPSRFGPEFTGQICGLSVGPHTGFQCGLKTGGRDDAKIGLGLRRRDAGAQAAHHVDKPAGAFGEALRIVAGLASQIERHPDFPGAFSF